MMPSMAEQASQHDAECPNPPGPLARHEFESPAARPSLQEFQTHRVGEPIACALQERLPFETVDSGRPHGG
jgi:hypothetical protein